MKLNADKLSPDQLQALKDFGFTELVRNVPEKDDYLTIHLNKFITQNREMLELKERVKKMAPTDDPVMIVGPTGTGKELLAKALHGSRDDKKFVAVNCAGIPEQLAESELFGHKKGAFTNAVRDRKGHFECANGGTIFLDEVAELSPAIQAKLLRVIQEGVVRPVGSEEDVEVSCRVVCATHQPIQEWVEFGRFREDLFYRLTTLGILRPTPLVRRKKDVPLILEALDHSGALKYNMQDFVDRIPGHLVPIVVDDGGETKELYLQGNVRSLQQLIRRYVVLGLWPDQE
jgi:transcriptional regulator with PAS, ATPase and Fis domain